MYSLTVPLLLAACSALLVVDGRSYRRMPKMIKRGDSGEDSSPDTSEEQCIGHMLPCINHIQQYAEFFDTIESDSIRGHCTRLVSITQCFENVRNQAVCREIISDSEWEDVTPFVALVQHACVDKVDALEKLEGCLEDPEVVTDLETCYNANVNLVNCDPNEFVKCAGDVITASSKCGTDAGGVFRDFSPLILELVDECEGPTKINKFVHKLLK